MTKPVKVLVVGGGGREHAIAWKLAQSPRVSEVIVAPGNGGTARGANMRNLDVAVNDFNSLLDFAKANADLTVIGPDDPLAAGIVDAFEAAGLRVFGPTRAAAQLEWSKAFCKSLLRKIGVPTGRF